jgi:hypothetical protein
MVHGGRASGEVKSIQYRRSPLIQGGLGGGKRTLDGGEAKLGMGVGMQRWGSKAELGVVIGEDPLPGKG